MEKMERKISKLMDEYGFTSFEKALYTDPYSYDKDKVKLEERLKLIEDSKSRDDFISKVLETFSPFDSSNGQLYAVFSKLAYGHTKRLKDYLEKICTDKVCTLSDVGSVTIGNDYFSVQVDNGRGDGESYVYIVDERFNNERVNDNMFDKSTLTVFRAKNSNISRYDCESDWIPSITLNGHYFARCYNGVVCIEKFRDLEE